MRVVIILVVSFLVVNGAFGQSSDFASIDFNNADSIASLYSKESLKSPEKLADKLVKDLPTEIEKFRAIFRWITNNIDYDYESKLEMERQETKLSRRPDELMKWRRRFNAKMEQRLMNKKVAICEGYSDLLEKMSNHAGITCKSISGYARTNDAPIGTGSINHAWNTVKLGTKWYLCDPTWARNVDRTFDECYFLADPAVLVANHYPQDTSWLLLAQKPTLKEFLNAPIVYTAFISNNVVGYYPTQGVIKTKRDEEITFSLTLNDKYPEDSKPNLKIQEIKTRSTSNKMMQRDCDDGEYSASFTPENRGEYTAELVIRNRVVLKYNIYCK